MKKLLFTLCLSIIGTAAIIAQDRGTKEEVDINDLRKEMEEKMNSMQEEMEMALQEMQMFMQDLQMNADGEKNEIIINGDTLIIANGDGLPGELGEMFKRIPNDGEGLNFYFGGDEIDEIFGMMEEFQGDLFNMENFNLNDFFQMNPDNQNQNPEPKKEDTEEEKKTKKVEKKRKTYSL